MNEVLKLKQLFEFGIPVPILARECHCSNSAIWKYLSGDSIPSGTKQLAIQEGLKNFKNKINLMIGE